MKLVYIQGHERRPWCLFTSMVNFSLHGNYYGRAAQFQYQSDCPGRTSWLVEAISVVNLCYRRADTSGLAVIVTKYNASGRIKPFRALSENVSSMLWRNVSNQSSSVPWKVSDEERKLSL